MYIYQFRFIIWVTVKIVFRFLGSLNTRRRIVLKTEKGTIILTTTHMHMCVYVWIYIDIYM